MGVDLGDLAVRNNISLKSLSGKIVAIDAFNMLYQFLASIRQEDGTPLMDYKGNVTAHLSGLFYRTSKLLENGMRPVYVFDGKAHSFKSRVQKERSDAKKIAEKKWKEALELEKYEDARKFAQATSRLTSEMIEESKLLLKAMGVPVVQAPSDGESQASTMVQKGIAYATASQDYDALMFGSPKLVRNISITGRRKVPRQNRFILVEPEEIDLQHTLSSLEINREKLIMIGILSGTDFNEGVKGVGAKTGLKIVKQTNSLAEVISYVREKYKYEFEVDIEEVFNFFLNPPYNEVDKLKWEGIDSDSLKKMLVEQHDFSEDRVERTIESVKKMAKEQASQSKLDQWF
ncbi:flap endonuclease-1 [Candidatus Micrarchaeota archaeon]|nr:flap endonuclease-1 [Candidatus Micrarchaeota archaeon]MBU1166328.1 flap endonuclease-1 [Candidatus Micrarchaeota archaeon]MBU1886420.1 flap endonuclease-1 [Candidatus Micrarchaeota archaeon]